MKKLLLLLVSAGALYGMDEDLTKEPLPQEVRSRPLDAEGADHAQADLEDQVAQKVKKARLGLEEWFNSAEVQAAKDSALVVGKMVGRYTQAFFYNEQEGLRLANIGVAATIVALWGLKRRFSGVGRLERQLELYHAMSMQEHQATRDAFAKMGKHLDAKLTDHNVDQTQRLNKFMEKAQR